MRRLMECNLIFCLFVLALPVNLLAQSTSTQARQVPAPWRPQLPPASNSAQIPDQTKNANSANAAGQRAPARNQNATPLKQPLRNPTTLPATRTSATSAISSAEGTAPQVAVPQDTDQQQGWARREQAGSQASNPASNSSQQQGPLLTRVTRSFDSLPNDAGQVWREYDISPYTANIKGFEKPEKAVIDWILQETGKEMWFHAPLGVLSADSKKVYVYHTPEIHRIVRPIIDRFVKTRGQVQTVDLNLVTVGNPNWRSQVYTLLQPIKVNSAGVEAWMVSKENAAMLLSALQRRGDFKQHSAGRVNNPDGQKLLLTKKRPVQFVQNLQWVPNRVPNFQPLMTQIDEGYELSLSSLSSLDNRTIEATIECQVDQVEQLQPVTIQVPGATTPATLQIPQMVSWRLKERIRWPADQVLLLSCGVVASPEPESGRTLPGLLQGKKSRADALMFIEYRGPAIEAERPAVAGGNRQMVPIRPVNR